MKIESLELNELSTAKCVIFHTQCAAQIDSVFYNSEACMAQEAPGFATKKTTQIR